jgi:hypothetical protein
VLRPGWLQLGAVEGCIHWLVSVGVSALVVIVRAATELSPP